MITDGFFSYQCIRFIFSMIEATNFLEPGGGARKSVWTPSSNIVEIKMGIKNLLSKLKSGFKEKRYDGFKKGA